VNYVPESTGKSPFALIFKKCIEQGKWLLFYNEPESPVTTLNSTESLYSIENIAFGSFSIVLSSVYAWVDCNMTTVLFGAVPLTIWLATKRVALMTSNSCTALCNRKGESIPCQFKQLKIMTRSINSVWATLVISSVIQRSLTIIWIHNSTQSGNKFVVAYQCILVMFPIIGAIIMADGCKFVSLNKSLIKLV